MFCSKCGHRISPNEKFCGNCGAPAEVKKENNPVKEEKTKYQVIDPKKPTFANKVENKPENKVENKMDNKPVNKGITPVVSRPMPAKVENKPLDKKEEVKGINSKPVEEPKKVEMPNTEMNPIVNNNIKAPLKTDNKFTATPQKTADKPKDDNKFEERKDNVVGIKPQSDPIKHEVKEKPFSAIEKNTLQPRVDEKIEDKSISKEKINIPTKVNENDKPKKIVIPASKINSINEKQEEKKIEPIKEPEKAIKPPMDSFTLGGQKDLDKTSTLRVEPPKRENDFQDLVVPTAEKEKKPENIVSDVKTPNTIKVETPKVEEKHEEKHKKKKGGVFKYAFVVILVMLITGGITYTLMRYQHNKELALQQEKAVDTVYANGFTYKIPQSLNYKVNNEGLVVTDEKETWAMSITAKKVQYQSLKADPQSIKSNYENNGCTASNQKNVTLKNREFMTFEVTCNGENTLVVYTKANDEYTYGVDIRNTDNTIDDSQLSTLATILNQSEYTEEKYLEVEDTSVNGIGISSFIQTEEVVPENPTE